MHNINNLIFRNQVTLEISINDLPPTTQLMAETIGLAKTLEIINIFGGSRIHFPTQGIRPDHPIRTILNETDCVNLSEHFSGTINVPRARSAKAIARDLNILQDRQNGLTRRQLSSKYALCERQIDNVTKKRKDRFCENQSVMTEARAIQLSLFETHQDEKNF